MSLKGVAEAAKLGAKSFTSSKPGKIITTGAAVGGAAALTGAGANLALSGVGDGIDKITDKNPFNDVIKIFKPDATEEQSKGAGTLISVGVIVGLVLLAVFVIIPQFNKSKKGGK